MATIKVIDGGTDAVGTVGVLTGATMTFTSVTCANGGALTTTRPWMDYVQPAAPTAITVPVARLVSVV